jgi:hypothetical protein
VSASSECPCGRARAGCEYHDVAQVAAPPAPVPTPVVDLQDDGPLVPNPGSLILPHSVRVALRCAMFELQNRKHYGHYDLEWAFNQDPPGTWILADVPAGYDRAAIGLPVATQAPAADSAGGTP